MTAAHAHEPQAERDVRAHTRAVLEAAGITVTEAGRQRARRRLAKAADKLTDDRRAELRAVGTTEG